MSGDKQGTPWPVPNMHFTVIIGDKGEIAFQKVVGLNVKFEIVEYRSGNSKEFSNVKMPLQPTFGDITLQKGMFANDMALFSWLRMIKFNTIARQDVTIQLLNEEHTPIFVWRLKNAFPKEIAFGELDAMKGTFAVEEVVIAHEGLIMEAV